MMPKLILINMFLINLLHANTSALKDYTLKFSYVLEPKTYSEQIAKNYNEEYCKSKLSGVVKSTNCSKSSTESFGIDCISICSSSSPLSVIGDDRLRYISGDSLISSDSYPLRYYDFQYDAYELVNLNKCIAELKMINSKHYNDFATQEKCLKDIKVDEIKKDLENIKSNKEFMSKYSYKISSMNKACVSYQSGSGDHSYLRDCTDRITGEAQLFYYPFKVRLKECKVFNAETKKVNAKMMNEVERCDSAFYQVTNTGRIEGDFIKMKNTCFDLVNQCIEIATSEDTKVSSGKREKKVIESSGDSSGIAKKDKAK